MRPALSGKGEREGGAIRDPKRFDDRLYATVERTTVRLAATLGAETRTLRFAFVERPAVPLRR